MKNKCLLISVLLLLAFGAFAQLTPHNALIDLKDATIAATPYTNRNLRIYPMSMPTVYNPSVVLRAPITGITDTNGQLWVSNIVDGLYQVNVLAPPMLEIFKFLIDTNTPVNFSVSTNLVADGTATFPAGSVSWAAAVTDLRYQKNVNGAAFLPQSSGSGTNLDLRWTLGSASQWIRMYKVSSTDVNVEYQSGAIEKKYHFHNNELHYDTAPYFDYISDFSAVAIFDGAGRLQSQVTGMGALTNDDNGNLGWYPNYASLDAANHFTGANLFSAFTTMTGGFQSSSDSQVSGNLTVTGLLRGGNVADYIVTATNFVGMSTANASGLSTLGFTNDVAHGWGTNSLAVRVIGSGQTINFYTRTGGGFISCGALLYTETAVPDATYPVGVNDGFAISGGSTIGVHAYAFP